MLQVYDSTAGKPFNDDEDDSSIGMVCKHQIIGTDCAHRQLATGLAAFQLLSQLGDDGQGITHYSQIGN